MLANRLNALNKWNDRIKDADYSPDYDPCFYREDQSMMKYDIFLDAGWVWQMPYHYADCHRTETFRTLAEAKKALRHALKMDYTTEPCISCPHLQNGKCNA